MFLYSYKCECGTVFDEPRNMEDRNRDATCRCGQSARRIFDYKGTVNPKTFADGYYPAFGKPLTTRSQLKEELSRYEGETGSKLVQVDDARQIKKDTTSKVDWHAVGQRIHQAQRKVKNEKAGS